MSTGQGPPPERPEAGTPAPPPPPGWAPPLGTYAPAAPYRRLAGLAPWIFWLLLVIAAMYVVSAVIMLAAHGLGDYTTPAQLDQLDGADATLSLLGLLQGLLELATAVLFIIWFYRAYENLRPLRAPEPRRGSGWTIGAWFVPILDLILPKLMLDETWRGGEPDPARDPREVRVPAFHHLWWATWVAGFVIAVAVGVDSAISNFDTTFSAGGSASTTASGAVSVLTSALFAVAAVLGALVVKRTTERQEGRWQRLAAAPHAGGGAAPWTTA